MSRLPKIDEVVTRVLSVEAQEQSKVAAEISPDPVYVSEVALSLKKLATHLRSAPVEVTYEDVFALGHRLLRTQ